MSRNGDWGAATELTALEAMMWRSESDPLLRSHGVVVELLDATPDWERLVRAHEWAIGRIPKLRQRIVDDPSLLGMPAWVDSEVDLTQHLTRTVLAPDASFEDALDVAARFHEAGLDRERPQWATMLVEGLPGGESALFLKLHHALADGTAVVQLLDLLHSRRRQPTPGKPTAPRPDARRVTEVELTLRHVRAAALRSPGALVSRARGTVRAALGATRHPGDVAGFVRSLARVAGPAPATPSPLLAQRSLQRRLAVIDIGVEYLRAAGKAAGGTLNDAFLAGLLGGLRHYHEAHGELVGDLPIALPVSLRTDHDAAGGNRFAGARIAGPVWAADPLLRMKLVGERVRAARDEPALDFMGLAAGVVSRVPPPLLSRLTASFTRSIDLQASNFRGLDRRAYIAGVRVLRTFAFGPAPGCGAMATLVSHEGRCCIALTIDTAAVMDADGFVQAMHKGFAEVLELAALPAES
jgi:diacylglycerol O-acyltransferase